MKLPFVSRERYDNDIAYRDSALEQMRRERDKAYEQAQRATDELIMRLGCAPVTPIVHFEQKKLNEEEQEKFKQYSEMMAGVDAESRLIEENLN